MPDIEFAGRSRRDASNPAANPARLLNLYRRPLGGEADFVLMDVLGQEEFADIGDVFLRAMFSVDDAIYAACGGSLYSVTSGAVQNLATVNDSAETVIRANNADITVSAGGEFYLWDGASLTTPTGGAFDDVGAHDFIGQHTVLTERNGRRFMWSAPADASDLDALDFATAEERDDDIIRPLAFGGNVWLFKETSIEVWYLTDSEDTTERFIRLPGGVIDTGLKSFGLLTRVNGGAAFVGDDGVVYRTMGGGREPLSVPAVHTAIERGEPRRMFRYEDEGHEIICLQFKDRPAWCCDLSSGEWHERAFGVDFAPWPVVDTVKMGGAWHAGTDLGRIARMVRSAQDYGEPLARRAVSRTLSMGQERFVLSGAEAYAPNGVTDLGRPATLWARFSKDGGRTWGSEKPRTLGEVGEYQARAVWKAQGQFRSCTVELTITDPMSIPLEDRLTVRIA